jgi:hypothetical protein
MTAWQRAISEASRRGYESALLIDAGARVIDPAPTATLDGAVWDVCLLATEGPEARVVALHRRAFGQILRDLRDDGDGRAEFLRTWGDLDTYLEQRVSHGVLAAAGAPFARPADARLTLSPGVETRAGDGGLTVRAPCTEKLYDLNESAALVLGLCDGRRTVTEIAAQLAAELTLSATPIAEVSTCVGQLLHAGVLSLNGRHEPPALSAQPSVTSCWPAEPTEIDPPQTHEQVDASSSAGLPSTVTVADPGVHGLSTG